MATLNLRPTLIGRRPAAASTRLSIEDIASGWRPGQYFFTPINYSRGALSTAPTTGHDIWIRRHPLLDRTCSPLWSSWTKDCSGPLRGWSTTPPQTENREESGRGKGGQG